MRLKYTCGFHLCRRLLRTCEQLAHAPVRCKWVSIKAQSKIRDLTSSLDGPSVWQRLSMGGVADAVLAVPHDGFGDTHVCKPCGGSVVFCGSGLALSALCSWVGFVSGRFVCAPRPCPLLVDNNSVSASVSRAVPGARDRYTGFDSAYCSCSDCATGAPWHVRTGLKLFSPEKQTRTRER